VRLAGHAFGSVAEGGAAIVVPGHLEDVRVGLYAFDSQARPEWPVRGQQIRDESRVSCALGRTFTLALTRGSGSTLAAGTPMTLTLPDPIFRQSNFNRRQALPGLPASLLALATGTGGIHPALPAPAGDELVDTAGRQRPPGARAEP
jgi:hypothetical protein